jgi:ribosomal protein S18 acetylase RimI-like enzyme
VSLIVRALGEGDVDAFVEHLRLHFDENGRDGTALFTPSPPDQPFDPETRRTSTREGLSAELDSGEWLRAWGAFSDGVLIGHLDLKARDEPSTAHRAVLGLGVLAPFRGRGVGRALLGEALAWARTQPLAWIDLYVFAENARAQRLYAAHGFRETGRVVDLFRVAGSSIDDVAMTLRL